jgi:3-oxoadipate enol-lactonase
LRTIRAGVAGPRVLLVHGIGTSATSWRRVMERLAPQFRLVAVDLRGYGDSSDPDAGASLASIVADVLAIVEESDDPTPWHIAGVSFGALAALALARERPDVVASLILADATLGRGFMSPDEREAWMTMRRTFADALDDVAEERARAVTGPHPSAETIAEIVASMQRARPEGYRQVAEIIVGTDALPWLPEVVHPTLVLCGVHDAVVGLPLSQTMAKTIPGARLVTFDDSGHQPHVEQPDEFAAAVREFITAVEQKAPAL